LPPITSNRALTSDAGNGSSERTIASTAAGTSIWSADQRTGVASASRYKCQRSAGAMRRVWAIASSTCQLALIGRPCSSHVYQVTPTPASSATSSRRSPAVRRRVPGGKPTSCGRNPPRRAFRNSPSSVRRRADTAAGRASVVVMGRF
jgi:hypothetical protein